VKDDFVRDYMIVLLKKRLLKNLPQI